MCYPKLAPTVGLVVLTILVLAASAPSQGIVQLKDIRSGSASSSPGPTVNLDGTALMSANDGTHGGELWATDGTPAGTFMVKDILSGSGSGGVGLLARVPGTASGDVMLFYANDGTHGRELRRSDGTSKGTYMVRDIVPGPGDSISGGRFGARVVGNRLFFLAISPSTQVDLWVSDGTPNGTYQVTDKANKGPDIPVLNDLHSGVAKGNILLFRGGTPSEGVELWRSDGTKNGTYLLKDIRTGGKNSNPGNGIVFKGKWYFSAYDAQHGSEMWVSDGTKGGTFLFKDFWKGTNGGYGGALAVVKDKLYFIAYDGNSTQMWATDGSLTGTKPVTGKVVPSRPAVAFGDKLVFPGNTSAHGKELWISDGTAPGTKLVKDIRAGQASSGPEKLIAAGTKWVYFVAGTTAHGRELWRSDGTPNGTHLVGDIYRGQNSSRPTDLQLVGENNCRLVFTAFEPNTGWELYTHRVENYRRLSVEVSIKRVVDRNGRAHPFWTTANIKSWMQQCNEFYQRTAGVSLWTAEIVDLVDPGLPQSWFNLDEDKKEAYERAAEKDPCRIKWRTDAINIYLTNTFKTSGGVCSFPACPADDNDIILVEPRIADGALGLAHEIGHYFNLRHTHANHEGKTCGCAGGSAGDCVDDTPGDANPSQCTQNFGTCHENNLKALNYRQHLYRLIRYNAMSYHTPLTTQNATLSCGQVKRLRAALSGPRSNVLSGGPKISISSVSPLGPSHPGPKQITVIGKNMPASGGISVRVGDQTAGGSGSATALLARYPRNISPGDHCLSLLKNGQLVAFKNSAMKVAPYMGWSVTPGTTGNVTLQLHSTRPRVQMIMGIGTPLKSPVVVPSVTYSLLVQPLLPLFLTTDTNSLAKVTTPMTSVPKGLSIHVQAVEIANNNLLGFTNALRIVLP